MTKEEKTKAIAALKLSAPVKCCPDIDSPEIEYVDATKNELLSIINKYKIESEESK
jgi:hypothetical protein